jgi:hypothetical protein
LTSSGFVAEEFLGLSMHRHKGSYYKWLQTWRSSWLALGLQLARLVALANTMPKDFLIFNDTLVLDSSTKAPSVAIPLLNRLTRRQGTRI